MKPAKNKLQFINLNGEILANLSLDVFHIILHKTRLEIRQRFGNRIWARINSKLNKKLREKNMIPVNQIIDNYEHDQDKCRVNIKMHLWKSKVVSLEVWSNTYDQLVGIVYSRIPNKYHIRGLIK